MENHTWWSIKMEAHMTFPNQNMGNSWHKMCLTLESLKPVSNWKIVCWENLPVHFVKINTDGSYTQIKARIGGIVRDHTGRMIMAFSSPIACSSNNLAEALAAKFGNGHTDNLKLAHVIDDILCIEEQLTLDITHCYWEANQVADALAEDATMLNETCLYKSWKDMPLLLLLLPTF
ncbi:hypothetical protein HAX54_025765, partial [Datura stramonium]|nr:hypothetical protein [Datura stramonium]